MAVQTIRTDDLTGAEGATTTLIVVNGEGVEIDLAPASAEKLAKVLAPYFGAGTPGNYDVARRERKRADREAGRTWDLADLRAWAASNGIAVPARGRIPAAIVEQYRRAASV